MASPPVLSSKVKKRTSFPPAAQVVAAFRIWQKGNRVESLWGGKKLQAKSLCLPLVAFVDVKLDLKLESG